MCSHLIVGLPGEGQAECLQTLERVVETGVDGIKLHPLHIVKGGVMAKARREAGRLNGIELEDYTLTAGEMIRHTPPEVIYHRISASARTSDAACSSVVRKSMDGNGRAGSLSE